MVCNKSGVNFERFLEFPAYLYPVMVAPIFSSGMFFGGFNDIKGVNSFVMKDAFKLTKKTQDSKFQII